MGERDMSNMKNKFGDLLREYRKAKGYSLGVFAGSLGMPATNLSDIELGRRQPLRIELIERAAKVLELSEAQVNELAATAAESRGSIELPLDGRTHAAEFGATLMREWSTMTQEDVERLNELVRELGSSKVKKK
jgi:transcriptional regulator with XRE-family HTH domain